MAFRFLELSVLSVRPALFQSLSVLAVPMPAHHLDLAVRVHPERPWQGWTGSACQFVPWRGYIEFLFGLLIVSRHCLIVPPLMALFDIRMYLCTVFNPNATLKSVAFTTGLTARSCFTSSAIQYRDIVFRVLDRLLRVRPFAFSFHVQTHILITCT